MISLYNSIYLSCFHSFVADPFLVLQQSEKRLIAFFEMKSIGENFIGKLCSYSNNNYIDSIQISTIFIIHCNFGLLIAGQIGAATLSFDPSQLSKTTKYTSVYFHILYVIFYLLYFVYDIFSFFFYFILFYFIILSLTSPLPLIFFL